MASSVIRRLELTILDPLSLSLHAQVDSNLQCRRTYETHRPYHLAGRQGHLPRHPDRRQLTKHRGGTT